VLAAEVEQELLVLMANVKMEAQAEVV